MTDKSTFFVSLAIIFLGILMGVGEGPLLSKLGWVVVGVGVGGMFIVGSRNLDKLFSSS